MNEGIITNHNSSAKARENMNNNSIECCESVLRSINLNEACNIEEEEFYRLFETNVDSRKEYRWTHQEEFKTRREGRILVRFTDITDFHIHVIFATDKLIAERPEAVRGFLKGWFETIAFMRGNKAETVAIAKEVTNKDEEITARVYDELMPMFSDDGRFHANALATLAKSYVELQLLPEEPDPKKLYTEAFLPKP